MLPTLNFYGNHNIEFDKYEYDFIKYHVVNVMRQLEIPDALFLLAHELLLKKLPGMNLSKFYDIDKWSPLSFPSIPGVRDFPNENLSLIGPMGMSIIFTPEHIILPSYIHERIDWYSPLNKEKVQAHRIYYYTVINQFNGDHALYVDERKTRKYYSETHKPVDKALSTFEQSLIERYGTNKKSIFDFAHGKYPKYYIDFFNDLKQEI